MHFSMVIPKNVVTKKHLQHKLITRQACADDRLVQNFTKFDKNVKIIEFHYRIWNHRGKCIKLSTNMPGIGYLIREIYVKMSEI